MSESGSVSVIVAAVMVLAVMSALVLGAVGQTQAGALRAQTAADAAALAAAVATFPGTGSPAPHVEAERLAAANGSRVARCICPVDPSFTERTVEITVRLEIEVLGFGQATIERVSRAEFSPLAALGYGDP